MLNNNLLAVTILFVTLKANACDFCTMLDYGNINNKSFVKLDYRFSQFKRYNQSLITPGASSSLSSSSARQGVGLHGGGSDQNAKYINTNKDYERFVNLNLGFSYLLKERYNLVVNIPVVFNSHYFNQVVYSDGDEDTELNKKIGFGDVSLGLQRFFIVDQKSFRHTFKLGLNVYMPTGSYDISSPLTENAHLEPGRSIYSLDLMGSYNLENVGLWGVNISGNYYHPFNRKKFVTGTSLQYEFGKRYSLDLNAYKIFSGAINKAVVIGLKNENNAQESVNGFMMADTGFNIVQANLGFTASKNKLLTKVESNIPIYQTLNGLQLKNQINFTVSLMYYIGKSKD